MAAAKILFVYLLLVWCVMNVYTWKYSLFSLPPNPDKVGVCPSFIQWSIPCYSCTAPQDCPANLFCCPTATLENCCTAAVTPYGG